METVGLLLRLLDPWSYNSLRLSVTLALAGSPHQILLPSVQLLWGIYSRTMHLSNKVPEHDDPSLCSKLIPATSGQTFHGPRNISSQPQWCFIPFPCNSSSYIPHWLHTWSYTLELTAGFDSPVTDHPYMKTSGEGGQKSMAFRQEACHLGRQTVAPFKTHNPILYLKRGVWSYSRRNTTCPVRLSLYTSCADFAVLGSSTRATLCCDGSHPFQARMSSP